MGWWNSNMNGESLIPHDTGMVWGDEPADILDRAIEDITAAFQRAEGRPPTFAELEAGLLFARPHIDGGVGRD